MRKRRGQAEIIGAAFFIIIAFVALFAFYEISNQYTALINAENQRAQQDQVLAQERLVQINENMTQAIYFNVSSVSPGPGSPPYIYKLDGQGLSLGSTKSLLVNISVPFNASGLVAYVSGTSSMNNMSYVYLYAKSPAGGYALLGSAFVMPGSSFSISAPIPPSYVSDGQVWLLFNASYVAYWYENLTITNYQPVPTANPFQQEIVVSSSNPVWPYIYKATGYFGQNVMFTYNGQVLPSWLENYSSGSATWWVSIPKSIGPDSSVTLQMRVYPQSVNLYSKYQGVIGEAPELSSSYGQYDSGFKVFYFYDDFAGTSLSSKWTIFDSSAGSISVNNGLIISPIYSILTASYYVGVYAPISPIASGMVLDTLVEPAGASPSGGYNDYVTFLGYGTTTSSIAPGYGYSGNFWGSGNTQSFLVYWQGNVFYELNELSYFTNTNDFAVQNRIYMTSFTWMDSMISESDSGMMYMETQLTSPVFYYNGHQYVYNVYFPYQLSQANQIVLAANAASSGSTKYIVYWVRIRAAPPDNVMPSVAFGQLDAKTKQANLSYYTIKAHAVGTISLLNENVTTYYPAGATSYLYSTPLTISGGSSYTFTYTVLPASGNLSFIVDLSNPSTSSDSVKVSWIGGSYSTTLSPGQDIRYTVPMPSSAISGASLSITVSASQETYVKEAIVQAVVPHVIVLNAGPYPVEIIRVWSLGQPSSYQSVSIYLQPGQSADLSGYFTQGSREIKAITSFGGQYPFYY